MTQLFLGVPRPSKLDSCNPKLISLLELEEFQLENQAYIGKRVSEFPTLESLVNLERHLESILERLQLPKATARLLTKSF